VCFSLLFCAFSCFKNPSSKNSTIKSSKKQFKKGFKQAKKLGRSADALLNATKKYEKVENTVDVLKSSAFSNLTQTQKEELNKKFKTVQKNVKNALKNHVKKIKLKIKSIRAKAKKIKKQLLKGKKIAKRAKALRKAIKKPKKSKKKSTTTSFISTKITKSGIQTTYNLAAKPAKKPAAKPASKPAAKPASKPAAKPASKSPSTSSRSSATSKINSVNKGIGAGKLANTCVKAFYETVPASICWKKGGDVGYIPTGCPSGYFRHLALCFENCRPGYRFDGGALCKKGCDSGWDTHPLTCYRWFFQVRGRDTYFPRSITNFEAPCSDGYYRSGALCYRDCGKVGMVNCGIGMCAASNESCGLGIGEMAIDVIASIGKGVAFVASFGTSSVATQGVSSAKNAIKNNLQKVTKAVKNAVSSMKILSKNPQAKKRFLDKAKDKVRKTLKEIASDKAKEKSIESICTDIHENLINKISEKNENSSVDWDKMDVLGIGDIAKNCGDTSEKDAPLSCSQSILKTMDNFDPTGLTGLAAAFMHPHCDI
jgi:hypothetical protein